MRKIGEIRSNITFIIKVDDEDRINPYKVYRRWYDGGWHQKQAAKYGNLHSCLLYIEDRVIRGE